MATEKEFELITKMYLKSYGKASMKIDKSIEDARKEHGFENGSALTDIYRGHLEDATKDIQPLKKVNEFGLQEVVYNDDGKMMFDKNDALKMLQAIDIINRYILD